MDIKEIYSNVLLISIANGRNYYKHVREAEEETETYLADYKRHSANMYDDLPEGYSGLYFMESLARKVGSSIGEVCLLTKARKEEIILSLLKNINPIENAYCDYYDDSIEGQVEFKGIAHVFDLTDMNWVRQLFNTEKSPDKIDINSFEVPYSITCQRIIENKNAESIVYYTLYITPADNLLTRYTFDNYAVWTGNSGLIADYIDKVIDTHEKLQGIDTETPAGNGAADIYSIILYKNSISEDLRKLTEKAYIQINMGKTTSRFLPVFANRETRLLYILDQLFADYRDELINGKVSLCESFSDSGKEINVIPSQEKVSKDNEGIRPKNDKFSIVICKDASNYSQGNEKQLIMIQKQENTRIYSPVYVDWDKHLIYFNEHTIVDNYKFINWNELELFASYNSEGRKVSINPLPTEVNEDLAKKAKRRELLAANEPSRLQNAIQKPKKNTKAKMQKKPRCPNCHRLYEGELIEDSFNAPGQKMCYKCYREFRISMRN